MPVKQAGQMAGQKAGQTGRSNRLVKRAVEPWSGALVKPAPAPGRTRAQSNQRWVESGQTSAWSNPRLVKPAPGQTSVWSNQLGRTGAWSNQRNPTRVRVKGPTIAEWGALAKNRTVSQANRLCWSNSVHGQKRRGARVLVK